MNKKQLIEVSLLGVLLTGQVLAVDFWSEDFETDGNGIRYVSSTEFNDGVSDHWGRTDGSNIANVSGAYSGYGNTFFWAGEDLDDDGGNGNTSQTLELTGIVISGYENLNFRGLFAAGNANPPGGNAYDSADGIVIQYQVDGGGYTDGICFSYEDHGDVFNEPLALDANCDGLADFVDGTGRLDIAMQSFDFDIPVLGTSLDILITATFDSANEEFAFDQLVISGDIGGGDNPPFVTTTNPTDMEIGVSVDSNIIINFSENVDATASAVTIDCGAPILFSGLPAMDVNQLILEPSSDLPQSAVCQVTVVANEITDLDGNVDNMSANYQFSFTVISPPPLVEIFEIQGNGLISPYVDMTVTTENNIVTALSSNGFFMQTPDNRDDADADTSNAIFVYTGGNPTVAEGDSIDVTGDVAEFFESTQIGFGSMITVNSSGNPLPTAITFDDSFPPNDPVVAVCSTDQQMAKYECMEGMLIDMPQGFISSAFASYFGANAADLIVRAGAERAFREKGVEYPGGGDPIPTFDGNPELMQVDIDALTLPLNTYSAGSEIAIEGILGFDFGEYEIWPKSLDVLTENIIPGAVADAQADEVTIGSLNLYNLYNDVDDSDAPYEDIPTTQEYQDHLAKLSEYIVATLKAPMILTVQEVENINTLTALADRIHSDSGVLYSINLVEGNDPSGKDIAFMYRDNVSMIDVIQHGKDTVFEFDQSLLHDRPPLQLSAQVELNNNFSLDIHLLAVHLRSRSNIDDAQDGERVRLKRLTQANAVADIVATIQNENPDEPVVVVGDFNAFQFTDGYVDVLGQIDGNAIEEENTLWTAPLFSGNPLTQAVQSLPADDQYSYVYQGSAQVLDNAILNDEALISFEKIEYGRGNADAHVDFDTDVGNGLGLRASDHDGLVMYFTVSDTDLIFKDGFE